MTLKDLSVTFIILKQKLS